MADQIVAEDAVERLLHFMGEDVRREGLKDTPRRVARMYADLVQPGANPPVMTTFPTDQDDVKCDQMVVVDGMSFWSLCEHHMVPFYGVGHIAYLPRNKVVGLSKLARVLDHFARRLQVQERLTSQVADFLMETLDPVGVCVILQAEHLCMSMRGVRKAGHRTTTHAIRGKIDKTEVLSLVGLRS